jgi:hypothetical protein
VKTKEELENWYILIKIAQHKLIVHNKLKRHPGTDRDY